MKNSCKVHIAIVSTCCKNPGFGWVSAFYSDTTLDRPKIFLLQMEMNTGYFLGAWCMPQSISDLPLESTNLESCIDEIQEKLGGGISFKASLQTSIPSYNSLPHRYFGGSWEASQEGIRLKPYKSEKNPFTGYGWFTEEEVKLLSMHDRDRKAALTVLSDPKKFTISEPED